MAFSDTICMNINGTIFLEDNLTTYKKAFQVCISFDQEILLSEIYPRDVQKTQWSLFMISL